MEAASAPQALDGPSLDFFCNGPAYRQATALFLATRFMPPSVTVEQVDDAVASTRRCLELEVLALCEAHGITGWLWQILVNAANYAFDEFLARMMIDAMAFPTSQLPN
jgi:hypothetical protein